MSADPLAEPEYEGNISYDPPSSPTRDLLEAPVTSPIFDQILSQREATPLFESISGSFPSVPRDDIDTLPSISRRRTGAERPARRPFSSDRVRPVAPLTVPTTTWPLGPVA